MGGIRNPRLVVVTGAGSGIGRATCEKFAQGGATVIATDINVATAEETAALIVARGGRAFSYPLDVSDNEAWVSFAEILNRDHGVPDVLVNNAGIAILGSTLEHTAQDWERLLGVDLMGVIHGCRVIGQQMVEAKSGGQIVNIASIASYLPMAMIPSYTVAKAGVKMFSEVLRIEMAPHGIGVTAICPGAVATGIGHGTTVLTDTGVSEFDRIKEGIAEWVADFGPRIGFGPDHIAAAIVRSVRYDWAIVPVRPEAWLMYGMSRLSPGLTRGFASVFVSGRFISTLTAVARQAQRVLPDATSLLPRK